MTTWKERGRGWRVVGEEGDFRSGWLDICCWISIRGSKIRFFSSEICRMIYKIYMHGMFGMFDLFSSKFVRTYGG